MIQIRSMVCGTFGTGYQHPWVPRDSRRIKHLVAKCREVAESTGMEIEVVAERTLPRGQAIDVVQYLLRTA